jgi:hypothetical protein
MSTILKAFIASNDLHWVSLKEYDSSTLQEGDVLRVKDIDGDEELLMFFSSTGYDVGLGLFIISGFHAGKIRHSFPMEAVPEGTMMISTQWLYENWNQWDERFETDVADVSVMIDEKIEDSYPNIIVD